MEKVTFTPLGRNRFKCNQTGAILKRQRTKKYALAYSKSEQNKQRQKKEENVKIFKGIDPPKRKSGYHWSERI